MESLEKKQGEKRNISKQIICLPLQFSPGDICYFKALSIETSRRYQAVGLSKQTGSGDEELELKTTKRAKI